MSEREFGKFSEEEARDIMGLKSKIPEIELAQINESEIPPPAPKVSLEEELSRYRKWGHNNWSHHLRAEKETETREKEGYQSPRNPDGSLDWEKVWGMLELKPPKRNEVFPRGEDKNLSDKEIERRLNKYMEDHDIPLWSLSGIAPEEFPEIIDRDIRDLCLKINQSNWIKTKEGCSGHREVENIDGTIVPAERGFHSPYLAVYLDRKDTGTQIFIGKIERLIKELKDRYSFVRTGTSEFPLRDEDLQKEDVRSFHFGMSIDPSPQWIERIKQEEGADYLDDVPVRAQEVEDKIITTKLPRPEDFVDEKSYVEAYTEKYHVYNYQRSLWQKYGERYNKKYGDFFRSEEAESIANEFFEGIRKIIEEIEQGEKLT
jgi:hypothetical protein